MKGETLVGIGDDITMEVAIVLQKVTMETFLSLMQEIIAERWERNVDEGLMMGFLNSGYVLEDSWQC